jgi:hypothetical protein
MESPQATSNRGQFWFIRAALGITTLVLASILLFGGIFVYSWLLSHQEAAVSASSDSFHAEQVQSLTNEPTAAATSETKPTATHETITGLEAEQSLGKSQQGIRPIVVNCSTTVHGDTLEVDFIMTNLPSTITVNRAGVEEHALEYEWAASIFLDGEQTGDEWADYSISANFFADRPGAYSEGPIENILYPGVWLLNEAEQTGEWFANAEISVDYHRDIVTLRGEIPGITSISLISCSVYDYFFDNESD